VRATRRQKERGDEAETRHRAKGSPVADEMLSRCYEVSHVAETEGCERFDPDRSSSSRVGLDSFARSDDAKRRRKP